MKLHSDSVIEKLEDADKEISKLIHDLKGVKIQMSEIRSEQKKKEKYLKEETNALKRALEAKIDGIERLEKKNTELGNLNSDLKIQNRAF